jgi:transposase
MTIHWTQKNISDIKKRLTKGESIKQIAESFEVSLGSVYLLCNANEIPFRQLRGLKPMKCRVKDPAKVREQEKRQQAYQKRLEQNRRRKFVRLNGIVAMRRAGATLKTIAGKYGVTHEAIRQTINRYNEASDNPVLNINNKRSVFPAVAKRREDVAAMVRSGLSYAEVARKLNVSVPVIRQDMAKYNKKSKTPISYAPNGKVRSDQRILRNDKQKIVQMRHSGISVKEIAKKYRVSSGRIYFILNAETVSPKQKQNLKQKRKRKLSR